MVLSFQRKKAQSKVPDQAHQIKQVELLFHKGKFDEALHEVEKFENMKNLDDNTLFQYQILKSLILTRKGDYQNALKLAERILKNKENIKDQFLIVDAYISLATVLLELGDLSRSFEVIEDVEKILLTFEPKDHQDFVIRDATLKHLTGNFYRKKGDFSLALNLLQQSLSLKRKLETPYEVAATLNDIGFVFFYKGKTAAALEHFQESLSIFEKLENQHSIVKVLNNIGMIKWRNGELDQALDYYHRCSAISEKLENKRYTATILHNIGLIYRQRGDFISALDFFDNSLTFFEELDNKKEIAICLNNIGSTYQIRGELDLALQFFQRSLVISEELEDNYELGLSFNHLGNVYKCKGEYNTAIAFFLKSLHLFEEIGDDLDTCLALYNMIDTSITKELTKHASEETKKYLAKLKKINDKGENKQINQRYRLAKAMTLKMSDRVIKRAEAQQIFQQIAIEEIYEIDVTVVAMLSLCDLLLLELRTSESEEALEELKTILDQLHTIAEEQYSSLWLTHIYLLQSKLALLELDLNRAQNLITKAEQIAEEKGLNQLATTILLEADLLMNQLSKWEQIIDQKPSVNEMFELTQFEKLLERMIYKKLYCREEEIQEYAEKARFLVEKWETK